MQYSTKISCFSIYKNQVLWNYCLFRLYRHLSYLLSDSIRIHVSFFKKECQVYWKGNILIVLTPAFKNFRHSKDIDNSEYMLTIGITSGSIFQSCGSGYVMITHIGWIIQILILDGYRIVNLIFNAYPNRQDKVNTLRIDWCYQIIQLWIFGIGSKTKPNGKEWGKFWIYFHNTSVVEFIMNKQWSIIFYSGKLIISFFIITIFSKTPL